MLANKSKHLKDGPWLYIISQIENSLALKWFFRELQKEHCEIHIVFLHTHISQLQIACNKLGYSTSLVYYGSKKNILSAFIQVSKKIITIRPVLIHAHLFDASLIGISSGWLLRVKQRIYTRHHASMHHEYFPQAVKYDKLINLLSTKIIAISEGIKELLINKENVNANKISVIYHGFDLSYFSIVDDSRITHLRRKYNILPDQFVIGMISRYTNWKGIQYLIPAFKKIVSEFPNTVLVLANAKGDFETEIKSLLNDLPINSYREILFENDSPALYKLFNIFVHVPIDDHCEAFGQVYIESLAANCTSIFTRSGIAMEFNFSNKKFTFVPYCDSNAIYIEMQKCLINFNSYIPDQTNSLIDLTKQFSIESMIENTLICYGK